MNAETKDWPLTLRINAASVRLAESIYSCQCEAFGPAGAGSFEHLPVAVKQSYTQAADLMLRLLKPKTPFEFISPDVVARVARQSMRVVK